mmetsp:Transcript_34705/g.61044  ORF Transcript_34705/g.61044 Transcript_34705/m.61044 type:complete len:80 (+) Transcript_34705:69-308(+)
MASPPPSTLPSTLLPCCQQVPITQGFCMSNFCSRKSRVRSCMLSDTALLNYTHTAPYPYSQFCRSCDLFEPADKSGFFV